jgi:hypothetical protein
MQTTLLDLISSIPVINKLCTTTLPGNLALKLLKIATESDLHLKKFVAKKEADSKEFGTEVNGEFVFDESRRQEFENHANNVAANLKVVLSEPSFTEDELSKISLTAIEMAIIEWMVKKV